MDKKAIIITGLILFFALCIISFLVSLSSSTEEQKARTEISDMLKSEAKLREEPENSYLKRMSRNLSTYEYRNGIIVAYKDMAVWYVGDKNICCLNGRTKQLLPSIDYCKDINYIDIKNILE